MPITRMLSALHCQNSYSWTTKTCLYLHARCDSGHDGLPLRLPRLKWPAPAAAAASTATTTTATGPASIPTATTVALAWIPLPHCLRKMLEVPLIPSIGYSLRASQQEVEVWSIARPLALGRVCIGKIKE